MGITGLLQLNQNTKNMKIRVNWASKLISLKISFMIKHKNLSKTFIRILKRFLPSKYSFLIFTCLRSIAYKKTFGFLCHRNQRFRGPKRFAFEGSIILQISLFTIWGEFHLEFF